MDSRMGECVFIFAIFEDIEQSKRLFARVTSLSMCAVLYQQFQQIYISQIDCLDVLQYNKDSCPESAPTAVSIKQSFILIHMLLYS